MTNNQTIGIKEQITNNNLLSKLQFSFFIFVILAELLSLTTSKALGYGQHYTLHIVALIFYGLTKLTSFTSCILSYVNTRSITTFDIKEQIQLALETKKHKIIETYKQQKILEKDKDEAEIKHKQYVEIIDKEIKSIQEDKLKITTIQSMYTPVTLAVWIFSVMCFTTATFLLFV